MNLESCFICKHPVLELTGQFEKLDTYLLSEDDIAYQEGAFGWCHASCLSKSTWGSFWAERRICNLTSIRGYSKLCNDGPLTVVYHPRTKEKIVLRSDGVSFTIDSSISVNKKDCSMGILLPVSEEINLELDESELVIRIRETLVKNKSFPLQRLIEELGLTNYLLYPEAITDGNLVFSKSLKREWIGNWVSANVTYNRFIPKEVLKVLSEIT